MRATGRAEATRGGDGRTTSGDRHLLLVALDYDRGSVVPVTTRTAAHLRPAGRQAYGSGGWGFESLVL
jgi:hypothetical protein